MSPWMICVGVGLVFLIGWSIRYRHEYANWTCYVAGLFCSICFAAATLGALILIGMSIGLYADYVYVPYNTQEMVSMRSNDGTSGKFSGGPFMSSGFIEQKTNYFYYIRTQNGGFQQMHVEAGPNATIFEQDRKDGKAIFFHPVIKNPKIQWIAIVNSDIPDHAEFYIPKGSIQKQFNLQ